MNSYSVGQCDPLLKFLLQKLAVGQHAIDVGRQQVIFKRMGMGLQKLQLIGQ